MASAGCPIIVVGVQWTIWTEGVIGRKYDEHIRDRRRHDGRDPPGGRMAAIASGRDRVGYPMAALRRLRASGGYRRPVRCGLQHSRRSCVLLSHIGTRNLLRLPVVYGATRPDDGPR